LLVTELKKEPLVREIEKMGEPQEDMVCQKLKSVVGSNSQPRTLGHMKKFINLEARQSTLESSYKEAREKCVRKIKRCIYALGLSFNIIHTPYWKELIEKVGSFGIALKQPSPYEISTRVLKAEVEDINKIKASHMAAWKKYDARWCQMDGRIGRVGVW